MRDKGEKSLKLMKDVTNYGRSAKWWETQFVCLISNIVSVMVHILFEVKTAQQTQNTLLLYGRRMQTKKKCECLQISPSQPRNSLNENISVEKSWKFQRLNNSECSILKQETRNKIWTKYQWFWIEWCRFFLDWSIFYLKWAWEIDFWIW